VFENKGTYQLTPEEYTLLDKTYKSFVRNGINLPEDKKPRLREIDMELSRLSLEFGENVLKETNAFSMEVMDKSQLSGLPEHVVEAAALEAKEKGKEGIWIFTLQFPSYIPFMTYADDRSLREKMFHAYGSKCFKGDENDNQQIILRKVKLLNERANLLGYKSHAHFVLEERMAESPEKVNGFL